MFLYIHKDIAHSCGHSFRKYSNCCSVFVYVYLHMYKKIKAALSAHSCGHLIKNRSTLQHTATHTNTMRHTTTHRNILQHTATHYNTLQHTTTHHNTLQHTTPHSRIFFHNVATTMCTMRCHIKNHNHVCVFKKNTQPCALCAAKTAHSAHSCGHLIKTHYYKNTRQRLVHIVVFV